MSKCASCQADVVWIKTKKGNSAICDPKVVQVITDEGDVVRGRISHFATCPQAEAWRKKREASKYGVVYEETQEKEIAERPE